ncbi:MAG: hypothetical protein R3Y46_05270 [Opitutales bacterium]
MEKYTIVCMKWGKKYGCEYVNRLYNMSARNCTLNFKFICYTDDAGGILPQVEIRDLPVINIPNDNERGWRKLCLFGKDENLEGRVLFLDLDTVIVGNIDEYFTVEGDTILVEHWRPSVKQGKGLTSIYRFNAKLHHDILQNFLDNMEEIRANFRHEQAYVCSMLEKQGTLKFWKREWMPSFKHTCMKKFPLNYFFEPTVPAGAKMVVFHGVPTPDQALTNDIKGLKGIIRYVKTPKWLIDNWS